MINDSPGQGGVSLNTAGYESVCGARDGHSLGAPRHAQVPRFRRHRGQLLDLRLLSAHLLNEGSLYLPSCAGVLVTPFVPGVDARCAGCTGRSTGAVPRNGRQPTCNRMEAENEDVVSIAASQTNGPQSDSWASQIACGHAALFDFGILPAMALPTTP